MCVINRNDSKKQRRIYALANASLAAGLMIRTFVHASGVVSPALVDFAVGLLIGLSIAANFHVILMRRRNYKDSA